MTDRAPMFTLSALNVIVNAMSGEVAPGKFHATAGHLEAFGRTDEEARHILAQRVSNWAEKELRARRGERCAKPEVKG